MITPFSDIDGEPAVCGFLHAPDSANGDGFVLAHGAGSNCQSKLLVDVSNALATSGFEVLRIDLPFRQARPKGPPFPSSSGKDREGIKRALTLMRAKVPGRIFAGGHSYGGRQTTILIAEQSRLTEGLLLLSYPLHPPGKPAELRTAHFSKLGTPSFFVQGTRDPFGSIEEMKSALELIPGPHELMEADEAGHDLKPKKGAGDLYKQVAVEFQRFVRTVIAA
jgi:uncharacterized protein